MSRMEGGEIVELSLSDELKLQLIKDELKKCKDSKGVLLNLMQTYISDNPNALPSIIGYIGVISETALRSKDKVITYSGNSVQYLISIESLNTKREKTKVPGSVVVKSFLGAMLVLFPTGKKGVASPIECEFFDGYVKDLKEWYESDISSFNNWLRNDCQYPKYIENLIDYNLEISSTNTNDSI